MFIILAGSSGCGKNTIINELLKENDKLKFIQSYTSRAMREGEENGKPYNFITKEEFQEKIKQDDMLEFELVHDNYYGTSKKLVQETLAEGKIIIKDIDVNGSKNLEVKLKDICPLVKIFLITPKRVLKKRLLLRGEKPESIKKRMSRYDYEQSYQNNFDYVIINGNNDKELTLEKVRKIIEIGDDYSKIIPTKPMKEHKIKEAFEQIKAGKHLKPCKVTLLNGEIYLLSGHERFVASLIAGVTIPKKFVNKKNVKPVSQESREEFINIIKNTEFINA